MAEQEQTAPAQEAEDQNQDPRPGYLRIETGSTKHPDAKDSEDGKVVATIGVFVGDSLKDAVQKYGEDFVMDNYKRSVIVTAQGKVRRELDQGVPVGQVEENLDDLDPTEKSAGITDPTVQAMRAFQKMDPAQREEFLKSLQG